MIPVIDLRKGNLIRTEYGVLPVHAIIFNEVQVKGKDGRILWAKEIEGVELSEKIMNGFGVVDNGRYYSLGKSNFLILLTPRHWLIGYRDTIQRFTHELQNTYYWIERKELEFNHE